MPRCTGVDLARGARSLRSRWEVELERLWPKQNVGVEWIWPIGEQGCVSCSCDGYTAPVNRGWVRVLHLMEITNKHVVT